MTPSALRDLAQSWRASGQPACVVQVLHTAGSVPREAGARMLVSATAVHGSIGGGHLEWRAIAQARALLGATKGHGPAEGWTATRQAVDKPWATTDPVTLPNAGAGAGAGAGAEAGSAWPPHTEAFALGPSLGQCCGGRVVLQWQALDDLALAEWPVPAPRLTVQLHGAGHVGAAIAGLLAGLDAALDWVDERDLPVPEPWSGAAGGRLNLRLDCDPVQALGHAPAGAALLVMTHRHDLDLAIVQAALQREDWAFVGLIGSATKRARFEHRLAASGLGADRIARLQCPIGLPGLTGKAPAEIAVAVVAQLLACVPVPASQPASAAMPSTVSVSRQTPVC